ncbi:MAG: type I 3-dehydroquinate dehydratase [Lachnospiraceae bacterium]
MNINSLSVRGVEFGSGITKICVPIIGKTDEEIFYQAREIVKEKPDCIEFRIDWYEHVFEENKVLDLLRNLREIIGNHVLLFTFRSALEGGEKDISTDDYIRLCRAACSSGYIDLLDVEAFMEEGLLEGLIPVAHENHVYIIGSNHNFSFTPGEDELYKRLVDIDNMGADIPKLAVMPVKERDVLNLLSATLQYYEKGGTKPIITMSMKKMGAISRLAGGVVGSALTFATVGEASAPGQLPIKMMKEVLKSI